MNGVTRKALAVAVLALAVGAAGCTDTTVEPKSTITEANIFNDVSSYKAFIAKVYAGLAVTGQQGAAGRSDIQVPDEGFSHYLRVMWVLQELPTDAAALQWNDIGIPDMNSQSWGDSNPFVAMAYYRVFFQVSMANEFLRQTTDAALAQRGASDAVKQQVAVYRAEARFLRALSYWHGIDLFGDIPMVTDKEELGATPPQQASRAEIFNFLVTELNEIKSQLPANTSANYGRATRAAASMLLAKLYLNAQVYTGTPRYAEALAAAQEAINSGYQLDTNWRRMFMADNQNSPEIIFAVTQDGQHTQSWGGTTFLIHAAVGGDMNAGDYGIDGGWWGLRLKPQMYRLFETGDKRASFFFTKNQSVEMTKKVDNWNEGIAAPKFTNKTSTGSNGSHSTFPDTDFPVFRLADAYLMYAEAAVRTNSNRAQALQYVNALRQRAFGDASHNITDAQMTADFILAERGRELMWEGHRRTDLIRYGLFTGPGYLWTWKGDVLAGRASESYRNLYPIPSNELVANPNLKQNPGY